MIPQTLNHYRILGPLGKGGMGEVYAAEDTRLHRTVAIKVLPALLAADPERRQRFEREAQAVAALNHPNIVTIHSIEDAEGISFLTMELVEGKPLGDVLAAGGLPVDALLRVGLGVTDAMAAAHQRGITHRDLKPGNIMVLPDGRVKVLDFGLAKLREVQAEAEANELTRMPTQDLTGEGRIIGTVAYMSPEQAEGRPVDQRSDIFSLGVVLHELATGEKPFKGDTNVSVISSILKDTPTLITDINPALPAGLAKVIRRSLSKDPSRRYQTATDLRNELEELKGEIDSGITASVTLPRPAAPARSGGALNKIAIACSLVLILTASAVSYALWRNYRGGVSGVQLDIDRLSRLTSTGNASLAAVSPDGRYVAHVKIDGGAPALWMRQTATTSDVQIVPPADVRYDGVTYAPDGDYVYYVTYARTGGVGTLYRVAALGGAPQRILEDVDSRISFSPDRSQFTFTRGSPETGTAWVMVANADGSAPRQLAQLVPPDEFALSGPGWSPDGTTIVAHARSLRNGPHSLIVAVAVASGATRPLEGRWSFMGDLEWLPDGGSFVVAAAESGPETQQLWQISYPRNVRRRVTNDLNTYTSLSLSGDASALAAVQAATVAHLWVAPANDPGGGLQVTRGPGRADGQNGLDWTPDGRLVYASNVSGSPQIWLSESDGRNAVQLTTQREPVFVPSVAHDGRHIVFQRYSGGRMQIWRMNVDGTDQKPLTTGDLDLAPLAGRDGSVYFSRIESGTPRPFRTSINGGEPVSLGEHNFRPQDVSVDGMKLLGLGWDPRERRSALGVMPATGGPPHLLPQVPAFSGSWAPDGRSITFWRLEGGKVRLFRYLPGEKAPQAIGGIPDSIFGAAWAPDGQHLALSRGVTSSDVLLITLKPGGGRQ